MNNKGGTLLHISNTDIRFDSRILKELEVIESLSNYKVVAIGLLDNTDERKKENNLKSQIYVIDSFFVKLLLLPRPLRYGLVFIESFFKILVRSIALKPTIVHCHDALFLPIAWIIKMICGSKLIYDAHELESNKGGQTKILSKATLLIEKFAWKKIDLLISVSPSIIDWYDQNLGKKPSLLILNSPKLGTNDAALSAAKSSYLRNKFNIPVDSKIFLYLGIITHGRGIEAYLDIFTPKNFRSHIVFMGYGDYVDKVKSFESQYDNIHYHPAVSHQEVVEISKSADVGLCMIEAVSLSDYYCLPNKLFEYSFSGLYVLASDFPDMKKFVEDYSMGICTSLDKDSIYKAIKAIEVNGIVTTSPKLNELSWEYQSNKLLEGYKKILENN